MELSYLEEEDIPCKVNEEIQLSTKDYEFLCEKKQPNGKLHKSCVEVFHRHIESLENIDKVDIEHQNSRFSDSLTRADSQHMCIYGKCRVARSCPVTYKFHRKELPANESKYVKFSCDITNSHDHAEKKIQIRGKDRNVLAKRIFDSHGGNAFETRLADLGKDGLYLKYSAFFLIEYKYKKTIFKYLKAQHQVYLFMANANLSIAIKICHRLTGSKTSIQYMMLTKIWVAFYTN
jgi:hypothetical protein